MRRLGKAFGRADIVNDKGMTVIKQAGKRSKTGQGIWYIVNDKGMTVIKQQGKGTRLNKAFGRGDIVSDNVIGEIEQ